MDVNPYKFAAPFDDFEFANYHLQADSKLIVCCMNWLTIDEVDGEDPEGELKYMRQVINYWLIRMTPLIGRDVKLIICNRTGVEEGVTYCGLSCVLDLKTCCVLAMCSRTDEQVMVVNV